MSKAKGYTTIRGKEPVRKLAVCTVEYDTGELYFDRIGRVVRQLAKLDRGWLRDATIGPKQTQVMNAIEELILIVTPGGAVVRLGVEGQPRGIEDEEVTSIADHAAAALAVVTDELELAKFQRVEYREHYSFACQSIEESEEWIRSLGVFRVSDDVYTQFGSHYALGATVLLVGKECRYRLELRGTERPGTVPVGESEVSVKHSVSKRLQRDDLLRLLELKRHRQVDPAYAAVLDMSAYLWDELDIDFDLRGFVVKHAAENLSLFRQCLPK